MNEQVNPLFRNILNNVYNSANPNKAKQLSEIKNPEFKKVQEFVVKIAKMRGFNN